MSTQQLQGHYETKYVSDAQTLEIETYALGPRPSNRYSACVRAIHRHFKGRAILELGAGSGVIAKSLIASRVAFERYTLTDIAHVRVDAVRKKLLDPRLNALQLDAEAIPVDLHGQYDAVILVALIEHLIDPLRAMQGIRELLRPGGFVYIDTPNIAKYTRRIKLTLGQFPSTASKNEGLITYDGAPVDLYDEGHLHYFTYSSLERMLRERCGFSRVEACPYFIDRAVLGTRVSHMLAEIFPGLFSEVAVVAYR